MINAKHNPYAIYDALLRVLVWEYDKALWLFRKPVRNMEKRRVNFMKRIQALPNQKPDIDDPVLGTYIGMHELSRHAIHMSETLQAAMKTVESTLEYVDSHFRPKETVPRETAICPMNVIAGIRFSAGFLGNLKLRSDAFVDRIHNEVQFALNTVSVHQLQETQRLLQESRIEGKEFTQFVTLLTLLFLPPTFVAVSQIFVFDLDCH
ncbi:hypothetical protein S7711_08454 [Stachybotrys chartarum IBT 7711]|uniref:Uncharacterized protein n=1 Tax=Stachybotrys chartarum (strain CBS 109288 / IBT 7711) TaxID=1280523 RepID=A0A084AGG3_STACB|nr:hypothetical protein S7711_08454 [Stachybotrys chartarum IBT 7711]